MDEKDLEKISPSPNKGGDSQGIEGLPDFSNLHPKDEALPEEPPSDQPSTEIVAPPPEERPPGLPSLEKILKEATPESVPAPSSPEGSVLGDLPWGPPSDVSQGVMFGGLPPSSTPPRPVTPVMPAPPIEPVDAITGGAAYLGPLPASHESAVQAAPPERPEINGTSPAADSEPRDSRAQQVRIQALEEENQTLRNAARHLLQTPLPRISGLIRRPNRSLLNFKVVGASILVAVAVFLTIALVTSVGGKIKALKTADTAPPVKESVPPASPPIPSGTVDPSISRRRLVIRTSRRWQKAVVRTAEC